jgi:high-affinity iron transporter
MLGNYMIGLREGMEAALIVSILLGYLATTGRSHLMRHVWSGVISAVVFSCAIAAGLQLVSGELGERLQEVFAGAMSFIAVGIVTWMIFWMKRSARTISADLKSKLDDAAIIGSTAAVAGMAFAAVAREGVETSVFFWAAAHAAGNQLASLVGLMLGLLTASAVGWVVYRSAKRVDLHRLFLVTGVSLVFIAAGVLSYVIHEWQDVGLLPGGETVVLDLRAWLPEGSVLAVLAGGLLNLSAETTLLQVTCYWLFVVTVLVMLLRPQRRAAAIQPAVTESQSAAAR